MDDDDKKGTLFNNFGKHESVEKVVSDAKVNILGALEIKYKKFPVVFKKIGKNHKKVTENRNFYAKPVFDKIDLLYSCYSKTNLKTITNSRSLKHIPRFLGHVDHWVIHQARIGFKKMIYIILFLMFRTFRLDVIFSRLKFFRELGGDGKVILFSVNSQLAELVLIVDNRK
ncbi:hypothetical protein AGLY_003191 [Aphis glycines]|uniref:Uncharacterized protein n=1 Tax=Aphis glycines TaxID=307491 RepID=A0A6G0U3C3_APHGL|nr:hypothetical protein AGLY_003191 [Aphis glycines]